MLIRDTEALDKIVRQKALEERQEQINSWIAQQTINSVYMLDEKTDPTLIRYRLGKTMTTEELEPRLLKLVPTLQFEFHPRNKTKKALYNVDQRGKIYLGAYESNAMGPMPERSIMTFKYEDVPDPTFFKDGPDKKFIDRKDLPAFDEKTGEWKDPDALLPGFIRVKKPHGLAVRGWRSILIRLVLEGLTTPEAVEREFGSDDTPEWKGHMGKGPIIRPW